MMKPLAISLTLILTVYAVHAREYHVSVTGKDTNPGSRSDPFQTISAASRITGPGDTITVHEGVYRESIHPETGGLSNRKRIVYQAAKGESVTIKGSEILKNWKAQDKDIWLAIVSNDFFGDFNPFNDAIHGDWFDSKGRQHHTGAVYLNGHWLTEAATKEDLWKAPVKGSPLWFAEVNESVTRIWAQFPGVDPNVEHVEINVRRSIFYPTKPGCNFITIRGFTMEHAATPWAPPTAEQIGLIGTHWSKGWVIEQNTIRYSTCVGITLGKHGDAFDNTSANSAEGYIETIHRGMAHGWSGENIGHHIVRNNHISHCEQAGIVGSLGPIFSSVTGNTIHDIHVRRLFGGAEMAGIKFHGAIDTLIGHNHIYRTTRGIWLDWMSQGTRVTGNLLHDNGPSEDLFVEVNHGPFVVDNNLLLSPTSLLVNSQGCAYAHNLITGRVRVLTNEKRLTPYLKEHSAEVAGLAENKGGDERYYNNLIVYQGLKEYDPVTLPMFLEGNVYLAGAKPCRHASPVLAFPEFKPGIKLEEKTDGYYLHMQQSKEWTQLKRHLVKTRKLGSTISSKLPFQNYNGSNLTINVDYFGKKRFTWNPAAGPFQLPRKESISLRVWPKR